VLHAPPYGPTISPHMFAGIRELENCQVSCRQCAPMISYFVVAMKQKVCLRS
jgi:hypothetical protein